MYTGVSWLRGRACQSCDDAMCAGGAMRLVRKAAAGDTGSGSRSCTAVTAQCTSAGSAGDWTRVPGANRM